MYHKGVVESVDRTVLVTILILLSDIPLSFFIFTLTQLEQLHSAFTHPRVLVEFAIFLTLLLIGVKFHFFE